MAKNKRKKVSKPKIEKNGVVHNEESFNIMLKNFRPEIYVLMDLLDNSKINPYIIFHVIKHLNNILLGTTYGKTIIEIEHGMVTFIRGEETTKLNENLKREVPGTTES